MRNSGEETRRAERQGTYSGLDSRLGHRLRAPGSEDVLVTHRGACSRPVAGDTGWRGPPRWRAGGEAAPRGQAGGGGAAADMPQGHPKERGSGVRPRLPCARRPPAGRGGLCGGAPRRMLSTSRLWKSLPGPRVCPPPPPAPPRPARGEHASAGLPAPSGAPAAPAPSGA